MMIEYIQAIRTVLIFFSIVSPVLAGTLTLECPTQDYVLQGSESDYHYITGNTLMHWEGSVISTANHGRFLNPGTPRSTVLKTQNISIQTNDENRALSFYCDLADRRNVRVAFTVTNVQLKDFGIAGKVNACQNNQNHATCTVS